jgi:hypothetical protein
LVLPYANAEAMNLHLEEIGSQVTPGSHAVLLLDGAGWHQTGGKLRVPKNISLLHPPPYSPELNPVENIWQFLRQNHLGNRVFESYAAIVDACCAAWNALVAEPGHITSITTRDWGSRRSGSPPAVRATRAARRLELNWVVCSNRISMAGLVLAISLRPKDRSPSLAMASFHRARRRRFRADQTGTS